MLGMHGPSESQPAVISSLWGCLLLSQRATGGLRGHPVHWCWLELRACHLAPTASLVFGGAGPATHIPAPTVQMGQPRWGREQSPQWALCRQVACDRALHGLGPWASVSLCPNLQCHLSNAVWVTGELSGLCPASPSGSILPTLQGPVPPVFDLQLKGESALFVLCP